MNKKALYSLAAAVALFAAIYRLHAPGSGGSGPQIGSPAPDHVWTDFSGQTAALSHYRGRVVLLDFWATWCASCQEELPGLQKVYRDQHDRGFVVLAPSLDENGRKALVPYLAAHAMPWKVLLSDMEDAKAYHVFGLPTKFLIDQRGIIARKYVGPVAEETLDKDVRELLAPSSKPR